jgi:hypothetical protein
LSAVHTKKSHLLSGVKPWLVTATGFGGGSLLSLLLLLDAAMAVPGIISGGAIGGLSMAYASGRREDAARALWGFGAAFLIGGIFSGLGIILANISAPFFYFISWYVSGFVLSGTLSALFTRSRFITVKNSAISFLVGSLFGVAAIAVLGEFTAMESSLANVIGIFITNAIAGALCGATSEGFAAVAPAELKQGEPGIKSAV